MKKDDKLTRDEFLERYKDTPDSELSDLQFKRKYGSEYTAELSEEQSKRLASILDAEDKSKVSNGPGPDNSIAPPAETRTMEEMVRDFLREKTGNPELTLEEVLAPAPDVNEEEVALAYLRNELPELGNLKKEDVIARLSMPDRVIAENFLRSATGKADLSIHDILDPKQNIADTFKQAVVAGGGPMNDGRSLGEILINPSFNPSQDGIVDLIKNKSADLIDAIDMVRTDASVPPLQRMYVDSWKQDAIDFVVAAQMSAVKAQTANFEKRQK